MLIYALIIIVAGILISATFSIITTTVISASFIFISTKHDLVGNHSVIWGMSDTIMSVIIIAIIAVMSWLSNHEIEKSLKRARKSEIELKKERDLLEIRVDERTKELREAQLEKLTQMGHFAELGKLASGVIHDLVNPITAVSLNLGQLKNINSDEINGVRVYLNQALEATKKNGKIRVSG
jgi:C4-dicarboxylate-specific signal transduction histidine kinase